MVSRADRRAGAAVSCPLCADGRCRDLVRAAHLRDRP
uniref:Uncharacterized protein n=1 Tax=uncultured bacterium 9F08 TaxID=697051 RepID=D2XIQ5_9BACT|nr:hypothetical protein [uncultured bacterium 9F08]